MRKELRWSLFAAAFVGAALAGCGGGGGSTPPSPAPSPSPSPSPPPSGPPTSPGKYFQVGRAGSAMATTTIPFFNQQVATGPIGLVYADPSNLPTAFAITTGGANQLEAGGAGLDLATVSEYFPSGGSATAWGIRYRVVADASSPNNSAGVLYAVDLRKSGTAPANPAPVQISNGTVTTMALCPVPPSGPVVFDNYRSANLSWIVFHAASGTSPPACGTLTDTFVAVQLAMTNSTAPKLLGQVEPIQALYDMTGTITGYLAINHPALVGGTVPPNSVQLEQLDASFASPKLLPPNLTGSGNNSASSPDFRSLGISTGNIWLYLDSTTLNAVDLTTAVTTPIGNFTLPTGASVQGRAVFDGTKAYVAFAGNGTGSVGSQIFQIDTTTKSVTATQALDPAGSGGITLVGVTSNNLVYLVNDGSAIKSLLKSNPATAPATLWPSAATSQRIDPLMGPNGPSGSPVAFLVGDTVYFTVADASASGSTGFAKQPFSVTFNSSGMPGAAAAVGAGVGAVLGAVAPASIPTSGPLTNAGVLVLTGGANGATAGQAVFANASIASTLGLYGAGGAPSTSIGAFTTKNASSSMARTNPITGVALNGPVQAGMPAMLESYGPNGVGSIDNDIAIFVSDVSIPLTELSGFLQ